ncbi:MAG: hypothetical protein HY000_27170 [Planctomycetes bacterium]|nr:hypothetical protein [Planctomycetota bacterium]
MFIRPTVYSLALLASILAALLELCIAPEIGEYAMLAFEAFVGFVSGLVSLLMTWVWLGRQRWPVAVALVVLGVAAAQTTIGVIVGPGSASTAYLIWVATELVALGATIGVLRLLGTRWTACFHSDVNEGIKVAAARRQFTVSDLILWTVAAAVVFLSIRLNEIDHSFGMAFMAPRWQAVSLNLIPGFAFACVTVGVVWSLIGRSWLAVPKMVVALVVSLVPMLVPELIRVRGSGASIWPLPWDWLDDDVWESLLFIGMHTIAVLAPLGIFKVCGLRFVSSSPRGGVHAVSFGHSHPRAVWPCLAFPLARKAAAIYSRC